MLTITNSHFSCDSCFLKWTTPLKRFSLEEIKCTNVTKHDKCDVVIDQSGLPKDPDTGLNIRRAKIGGVAELPCYFTGSEVKAIEWRRVYPDQLIAYIPISELNKPKSKYQPNHYQVLPGGHLLVKDAKRELVERYKCNVIGLTHNASVILNFRLDFSQWYSTDVFNSVFWGACVCSLLTCLASFLFNITWIILKNVGLWWLNRAERLSRVKGMVDAMEKYRQRQMERIQERYHKNIENIRDNYHNQVETLRVSYANQTEKFKDFKQQRLENVSQHLEGIKDHYNQQVSRIKDFGSKRAEALCDSYEQQLTRVKAFTLQNRLKLMRQYKVKQKFINKLLERYNENEHNMDDADKEATLETVLEGGLEQTSKFVERSPSYYSLPEYVTGDDDSIVENTGYTSPNRHLAMNRCNLDVAGSSKSSKYSPISENPSSSGISSLKTKPYDSVSSSLLTDSTIDTFKARGSDKIKPRKKSASTCESEFSGSNTNENGKRIN
uniref:Ig-like domain-containing protein n=1 Tax=Rhabditophanes sp. KR3021 TaxID=114890 RepID=A0AC35TZM4_9BILA